MKGWTSVDVATAVLGCLALIALVVGLVAAAARWSPEATAGLLSVAVLVAAAALGLRIARAATVVAIPLGPPTGEVPRWPAWNLTHPLTRRRVLVGAGAAGVVGVTGAVLLPRTLPARPPPGTAWRPGVHVVTTAGRRLRVEDIPRGGIATVWPEGDIGDPRSVVVLVRLTREPVPPTDLQWVVEEGVVGYSKVCTHAGCAVGLFRSNSDIFYCPCHQAMFDAARGAVPIFGPASVPLPQLPLGQDDDGFLVALGDFTTPVEPPQ